MMKYAALFAASAMLLTSPVLAHFGMPQHHQDKKEAPQIQTGNGERNNIMLEGATRSGATFTFPRVEIERNGWLVMHPFKDGKPVPTVYVGHTQVKAGVTENVDIDVDTVPDNGEMFIVMLHFDMNDDGVFDFNDGITVPDAPVFEGSTLVALRYVTPDDSGAQ
ncbi:DUF7282 domain-containing protein [Parasphingorhabdus sp. DH2-15]|uniref:DUF7282 domain-containing protein n=1 Tax=Parasphingorhabdus sp. DH2-15 TaxID=3444112 RepID=UPI003F6848B3